MKRKLVYLLFPITLLLAGCTEVIDFDLKEGQDKLVVEGSFTTETKAHHVRLSLSNSYFSNEKTPAVSGAQVSISDGSQVIYLMENPPASGIYETPAGTKAEVGKTYTLDILYNGEVYSATSFVHPVAQIDSIRVVQLFEPRRFHGGIDSSFSLLFYAREPAGLGDYYMWHYYKNGILKTDTLRNVRFAGDESIDGNYLNGYRIYRIHEEELQSGDTVTLIMYSISKMYNDFITGTMLETVWRGGPFDGPPANAKGNISNGAIGFFYTSDFSKADYVIE